MSRTILFLDFDGVLHPAGGTSAAGRFARLPLLEALLLEPAFLHVEIVVSSTWREAIPLARLRGLFPETLRGRVVDCTPQLDDADVEHPRYREIRAWLNRNPGIAAWAALDDSIAQFPDDKRERAVFTDPTTGLDDAAIAALRALLSADRGPR